MRNIRTHHEPLAPDSTTSCRLFSGELLDQPAAQAGAADLVAVVVSLGLHLVVNPLHVQAIWFPTRNKD